MAALPSPLPQAMGYERAMRFMMENRTVLGDEAVALGMAGEVVDDEVRRQASPSTAKSCAGGRRSRCAC